jgi:hypothetical protein
MRIGRAWILLSNVLLSVHSGFADPYPYAAYVTAEHVQVRSGPGEDYYVTDELPRGDEVEVYWQNGEGWLAIRPPSESFSLVPQKALDRTEVKQLGTIVDRSVASRIGSQIEDEYDVTQVELQPGEVVEILGTKQLENRWWYMIAPPSGEFRWIHANHIDRQLVDKSSLIQPTPVLTDEVVPPSARKIPVDLQVTDQAVDSDAARTVSWTRRDDSRQDRVEKRDKNKSSWRSPQALDAGVSKDRRARSRQTDRKFVGASDTSQNVPKRDLSERESSDRQQLMQIQIELSQIVAGPPATWQLGVLRLKIRSLSENGKSATERAQARRLLERVAEFEEVRLRHEELAAEFLGPGSAAGELNPVGKSVSSRPGQLATARPTFDPRFDGSGWLMPVITQRTNVPRYALTDDYGRILKFVTPSPGLNVRRYLRKQIGVSGTQQMLPDLKRPHLTAERITVLDRHRR